MVGQHPIPPNSFYSLIHWGGEIGEIKFQTLWQFVSTQSNSARTDLDLIYWSCQSFNFAEVILTSDPELRTQHSLPAAGLIELNLSSSSGIVLEDLLLFAKQMFDCIVMCANVV